MSVWKAEGQENMPLVLLVHSPNGSRSQVGARLESTSRNFILVSHVDGGERERERARESACASEKEREREREREREKGTVSHHLVHFPKGYRVWDQTSVRLGGWSFIHVSLEF